MSHEAMRGFSRCAVARVLGAMALVAGWLGGVPAGTAAEGIERFDGHWMVVLSCPNTNGALGYSFEFPATVTHGVLHAEKGRKGEPGWLQIDGTIGADGAADLYASGLVGAAPYAVGQRPAGSLYGYHLDSKFTESAGEGRRVEGRPCSAVFKRS